MRPVRPFATVASIPECLVVATFLAAAAGAGAQGTEPGIAPPVSSVREPGLSLTEAELVGAAAGLRKGSRDVPVIAEAPPFTLSVNAFVKHLPRRSRPAAHFCESEHAVAPCPPDTRLSFYSGHTSGAFAAAVAAGTIADFHR